MPPRFPALINPQELHVDSPYFMPSEGQPHIGTLMAWPELYSVNDETALLHGSREEVLAIAIAIAAFEPVTIYCCRHARHELEIKAAALSNNIIVQEAKLDNLWARDTFPTFVKQVPSGWRCLANEQENQPTPGILHGVDFHFNDWGDKDHPDRSADRDLASRILRLSNIGVVNGGITTEGGSFEVDGQGTLLATESSIINRNRNPGKNKDQIERALKYALGVEKIIWLKGVKGMDITDYHVDGLARFVRPGLVAISKPAAGTSDPVVLNAYSDAKTRLMSATDARNRPFKVVEIVEAGNVPFSQAELRAAARAEGIKYHGDEDLQALAATTYINWYLVNGGVILPRFGDDVADEAARRQVGALYPDRKVVQVYLHTLPLTGGGIHCSTQQVPA